MEGDFVREEGENKAELKPFECGVVVCKEYTFEKISWRAEYQKSLKNEENRVLLTKGKVISINALDIDKNVR